MPIATIPDLDPDEIDDIFYLARTGETAELRTTLSDIAKSLSTTPSTLLLLAIDPDSGNSTLHMASANGHTKTMQSLLILSSLKTPTNTVAAIVSPLLDLQNNAGNTPLHWAALNGHLEAVKILVEAGADVMVMNKVGRDARGEAEAGGKIEVGEWLGARAAEGKEDGHGGVQATEEEGER